MNTIKILFLTFLFISFGCQDNTEIDEIQNLEKTEKLSKIENNRNKLVSESKLLETLSSKKFDFEILNSNVIFDNQDNLMQIDNGEYFQNWDLENNKPANPFFAMKIVENRIILKSKKYFLLNIIPVDFYGDTTIRYSLNGKKVVIKYNNINEHVYQTDFFKFNISYVKQKTIKDFLDFKKCNKLKISAFDFETTSNQTPNTIFIILEDLTNGVRTENYIENNSFISINQNHNYKITVALTEDLFVKYVTEIDATIISKCTIKANLIHTE